MNTWISALLNTGRRQNILKMFGRKPGNRGMMWASLVSLGVSAAAYGLGRNRNRKSLSPVQNIMNNIRTGKAGRIPNTVALTEFAKELAPNKKPFTNK